MSFFYRNDNQQERVPVSMPPDEAFQAAVHAVERIGSVKEKHERLRRVVGSTRMRGLAYATLTIVVEQGSHERASVLSVNASAPDGVPKRGYATKGISRLLDALEVPNGNP